MKRISHSSLKYPKFRSEGRQKIFLSNSAFSYQVPNKTGGNLHLWTTFIPEMELSSKVLTEKKGPTIRRKA
jgi:hypothetical protein